MSFLFQLFFSRASICVALCVNALDAVSFAAAVLSGEATADLQVLFAVFGFAS